VTIETQKPPTRLLIALPAHKAISTEAYGREIEFQSRQVARPR